MYEDDDDDDGDVDDVDDGVGLKESGGKENMSQEQVMEMLKMHERLLYTILATIGIPLVLIILFYIEVSLLFLVLFDGDGNGWRCYRNGYGHCNSDKILVIVILWL